MSSRIPYWPYVSSDSRGVAMAQKTVDEALVLDKSVPDTLHPAISFAAAAVLLTALVATLLIFRRSAAVRKLDPGIRVVLLLYVLVYWGIFGITISWWRFS